MTGKERSEGINTIVCPRILSKVGFYVAEDEDRSVGPATCKCAGFRERNSVMEGKAERFVNIL